MAFHMTGIYQVYTKNDIWYIPGIYLSYDIPCHMTGIYLSYDKVYTVYSHMSGIYQVYTMIINFLGFPDVIDLEQRNYEKVQCTYWYVTVNIQECAVLYSQYVPPTY